jgi:hypothetical protein
VFQGAGSFFYTLAEFIAIDGRTYMQQCIFEIVIRSSCSLHVLSDIYTSKYQNRCSTALSTMLLQTRQTVIFLMILRVIAKMLTIRFWRDLLIWKLSRSSLPVGILLRSLDSRRSANVA